MANFRRTFKPTKRERIEDCMYLYHLYLNSKSNKHCTTCKYRKLEEYYCIGGVKDCHLECELGLETDKDFCDKYELDKEPFNEIIDLIEKIFKEEEND